MADHRPSARSVGVALGSLWRRHDARLALAVPLLLYAVLVSVAAVRKRDRIHADTVSYVRTAKYLAQGRLRDSVSPHWSPLLPWTMAPFMALGVDGLHAGRIALALWGAVLVLVSFLFMRRFAPLAPGSRLAALAVVALLAVRWATNLVTPDLVVAACLMLYFWRVTDPDVLQSARSQIIAGVCGGVAYLAKAYAFPFFLVHFPLALLLRRFAAGPTAAEADGGDVADTPPAPWGGTRRLGRAWGFGMLGFLVVALPWAGLVSGKLGRPSIGTAGAAAHAIVGPPFDEQGRPVDRRVPVERGLWPVRPGRITAWETPEELPYRRWSPFGSAGHFAHQVRHTLSNLMRIRYFIAGFDLFGFSVCALGLAPVLAVLLRRRRDELFRVLWIAGTSVVFCGGYSLVFVDLRFIEPVLWPLLCIFSFHLAHLAAGELTEGGWLRCRAAALTGILLPATLTIAFATFPALLVHKHISEGSPASLRAAGSDLRRAGVAGPVSSTDWHGGLYVAYHMDEPYLGTPRARTPGEWNKELVAAGARTLLVWRSSRLPAQFVAPDLWRLRASVRMPDVSPGEAVDVYLRAPAETRTGTEEP